MEGGLLGLALGDALGAPHEGGPLERCLWLALGRTLDGRRRWTDDTAMALDLAEALLATGEVDQDDLAARFSRSYAWSRGYGPGTAALCRAVARGESWRDARVAKFPMGSSGNGAAMRAPVLGLLFHRAPDDLDRQTRLAAEVTHAHPLALEGAVLVARATASAFRQEALETVLEHRSGLAELDRRAEQARSWLREAGVIPPDFVAQRLGNGIAAAESCVTAVYVAARFLRSPFEELLGFVRALRGDVDTISAMAGAMWGAANGAEALPQRALRRLEAVERIRAVAFGLSLVASQARDEALARVDR